MLSKEDYVSRKLRLYLKDKAGYEDTWPLYTFIKDTLFFDEWPLTTTKKEEIRALEQALEDWKVYINEYNEL